MMSQPAFNWKVSDRYVELLNFEMDVANVLQADVYDISEEGRVPIMKNCLGRERLHLIQTLTIAKKEAWKMQQGFLML